MAVFFQFSASSKEEGVPPIIGAGRTMLPTALTEPSCFCHVDGCRKAGGANMAVGDEAALCGLMASIASSGSPLMRQLGPSQ